MQEKRYLATLTGETSLIMHADNPDWADYLKEWRKDPANKKASVAGDDRSPAWSWVGSVYHDDGLVVVPSDNLMTVLREGGAKCPTGKGQTTFKRQSQSGIQVDDPSWPLLVGGSTVSFDPIKAMIDNPDYKAHQQLAEKLGFELFAKRARITATAKHLRVRPRFNRWSCSGTITVLDEMITEDVLRNILVFAGRYSGLGDWRPSAPKSPGPWGKFSVELKEVQR